jgi:hypothetical protein
MAQARLHENARSGCTEYEFATRDHDNLPVERCCCRSLAVKCRRRRSMASLAKIDVRAKGMLFGLANNGGYKAASAGWREYLSDPRILEHAAAEDDK